jgi:hypothetical protein|tara:strand:+ start:18 stop:827 length:810 start_codon:yes stop_codon:yes gene_type:complete
MKLEDSQKSKEKKIKEIKKTGDSLFVATPVHSGCDLHYMKSCLDLQKECLLHNVNITFQIMQSSLVTQGRNLCVDAFLQTDHKQFLFIDSDIAFSPRSVFRLYDSPHDVTVIPYPMKSFNRNKFDMDYKKRPDDDPRSMGLIFPIELMDNDSVTIDKGFLQIKRGPTGMMMIKREVFEKMMKEYPEKKIKQQTMINGKLEEKKYFYNFFDSWHNPEDKTYTGEDFYFCKLWTDIGGKIHAICDEHIEHFGMHSYQGKLLQEFTKKSNKT